MEGCGWVGVYGVEEGDGVGVEGCEMWRGAGGCKWCGGE